MNPIRRVRRVPVLGFSALARLKNLRGHSQPRRLPHPLGFLLREEANSPADIFPVLLSRIKCVHVFLGSPVEHSMGSEIELPN